MKDASDRAMHELLQITLNSPGWRERLLPQQNHLALFSVCNAFEESAYGLVLGPRNRSGANLQLARKPDRLLL